jgi:superfamily II DNA or RNA helicase
MEDNVKETSYLSKFGYVIKKESLSSDDLLLLKKELTARPLVDDKYGKAGESNYPVYVETKTKLYIPKMFGVDKYGIPKASKEYNGKEWDTDISFKGSLFSSQMEPVDALLKACYNKGGGILALGTGGGKSVIALYTLSQLKRKTLIVVNKITLMKQWENEIHQFLPDARVGIIQGQKNVNVADTDIVIAMLQSLSKIDYPQELFNDISVVVLDEAHNVCSKSFSKIFFKICSKYTIGLSATPERSDGCEKLLQWHIGDIVYQKASETKGSGLQPIIKSILLDSSDYKEIKVTNQYTNEEQIQFNRGGCRSVVRQFTHGQC